MSRRIFTRLLTVGAVLSLVALASGGAAQAQGYGISYQLAATFQVPVPPDAVQNGWCYDTATVNPQTHLLYLADGANKQITVIDPGTGGSAG